ncbi:MAG: FHA domain-containing protein [Planctomycetes bacterium]|nr:FHA domain-containing protein [Planctomycetota bacterium]
MPIRIGNQDIGLMEVKLIRFSSDGKRAEFPVTESIVIGRADDCGLRVLSKSISRYHCEIALEEDNRIKLKDLGSSNGTFLNGRKIREAWMKAGDKLTLGPFTLILQVNGMPRAILASSVGLAIAKDDTSGPVGGKFSDTISGIEAIESPAAAKLDASRDEQTLADLLKEDQSDQPLNP